MVPTPDIRDVVVCRQQIRGYWVCHSDDIPCRNILGMAISYPFLLITYTDQSNRGTHIYVILRTIARGLTYFE